MVRLWDWKTGFKIRSSLQPDLSGNPFLRREKRREKDWERKAEKAAQIILLLLVASEKQNGVEKYQQQIQCHPNAEFDVLVLQFFHLFCGNGGEFQTVVDVIAHFDDLVLIFIGNGDL